MTTIENTSNEIISEDLARAERIRDLMAAERLRQVDISKAIGASRSTVSKWLAGTNTPAGDYLRMLARLLKTSPDWIIDGDNMQPPSVYDIDDAADYALHDTERFRSVFIEELGLDENDRYDIEYLEKKFVDKKDDEMNDALSALDDLIYHSPAREPFENKTFFKAMVYSTIEVKSNEIIRKTKHFANIDHSIASRAGANPKGTIVVYNEDPAVTDKISIDAQCLIDVSKRDIKDGKTYLVKHGLLMLIRKLYRNHDGGVRMRAANNDYDDVVITRSGMHDFVVVGWLYSYMNIESW
ncbi:helix-turn-helix domain-containing protein [Psychrobacter sp.]|uniref:helix-turn-helix domain-containing protein n=1 Tax=unclassified Psychrobacter TaxID=196806 RepID=UPI003F9699A7